MDIKKGFTLIELIVVIAIIAILAAIIAPNAFKAIEKARVAKTVADLKAIVTGIAVLYADTGKFPLGCPPFERANPDKTVNGYNVGLLERPKGPFPWTAPSSGGATPECTWTAYDAQVWDGPYIEGNGLDVWKQPYWIDPDFCACEHKSSCPNIVDDSACTSNKQIVDVCNGACGSWSGYPTSHTENCFPPTVRSNGPDKLNETCDDIPVLLTLTGLNP